MSELHIAFLSTVIPILIGLVGTLGGWFIMRVKSKKEKFNNIVRGEMIDLIIKVEQYKWNGLEKKEYVVSKIENMCYKHGMKYDTDTINNQIDLLVDLSRKVNRRGTHSKKEFENNDD